MTKLAPATRPINPSPDCLPSLATALSSRGNPTASTIVICGDHARDDVVTALASTGPHLGVEVMTVDMVIDTAARSLSPLVPLDTRTVSEHVEKALAAEAPATVFHEKNINTELAVHSGVTEAIMEFFQLPPTDRDATNGQLLPQAIADLAHLVERATSATHFTYAQAAETALDYLNKRTVFIAGDIATSPFKEWFLSAIAHAAKTSFGAKTPEESSFTASFVHENDEAAFLTQDIRARVAQGVPLHSMAVGYCEDAYLPRLALALDRADIPFRTSYLGYLSDSPYSRAAALLVKIDPAVMPRPDVASLLATGVIAAPAPTIGRFDRATRGGDVQLYSGSDWGELSPGASTLTEIEGRVCEPDDIKKWVLTLKAQLTKMWDCTSWEQAHGELLTILMNLFGKRALPHEATTIANTLAEQAGPVNQWQAISAVLETLENPLPGTSTGRLQIGNLESLCGRELKVAYLCGCTDEALPGSVTSSPTFTQAQTGEAPENFLARRSRALTAARNSASTVVTTYPRSRADGSGTAEPSLWIGEPDKRFDPIEIAKTTGDVLPLNSGEINTLSSLCGHPSDHAAHYLMIDKARTTGAISANEGGQYNGFLHSDIARHVLDKPLSNSALENFTTSPLLFFLEKVAGGRYLEAGEASSEVDSRDRGTIYHNIFEKFINRIWLDKSDKSVPYAETDWDEAQKILDALVEAELQASHSSRITQLAWEKFCSNVRANCQRWLKTEQGNAREGWTPLATELAFGPRESNPHSHWPEPEFSFTMDVSDDPAHNKALSFVGKIDRIDYLIRDSDSGPVVDIRITDYKSGKGKNSQHITHANPTGDEEKGFKFQLALYGAAMRSSEGLEDIRKRLPLGESLPLGHMSSRYWFFLDEQKSTVSIEVNDFVLERLADNLNHFYDHVVSGNFPPYYIDISAKPYLKEIRQALSATNYDTAASALETAGITPLQMYSSPAASEEGTATTAIQENSRA